MKSAEDLYNEITALVDTNQYVPKQPMYNLKATNNIVADFAHFTDVQSGRRSADAKDHASMYPPPYPAKDGKTYHTVRDITWATFKQLRPDLGAHDFYEMTDEVRFGFIKHFFTASSHTRSAVINSLLTYCSWGSGSCAMELVLYRSWYKSNIDTDIRQLGERVVFDRLTDIRLYRYSTMPQNKEYPGWVAGMLNFWRLFRSYCKS